MGKKVAERPFTGADISIGTEIFDGTRQLSQGGPACISCHTLGTLHGMGGGRLGPDLTLVYERLGGRKGVGAWLSAPGTTTMQAVFRRQPAQVRRNPPLTGGVRRRFPEVPAGRRGSPNQFLRSQARRGVCLGLALMGWIWRGRIRTVRRSLIRIARGAK